MTVAAVSDQSFAADVLGAPIPVLVDVWAPWCAPCVALKPIVTRLAETYAGRVRVVTLEADTNVETVARFDVRALPTLLLFERGVLVERLTGAQSSSRLSAVLDRQLEARALGVPPIPVGAPAASPPSRAVAATESPAVVEAKALVATPQPMVVFKHSATCSISIAVKREYDAFVSAHPDVATRLVVVQRERPLSNALESVLRVQHESPQAIIVRDGRVIWHASHRRITVDSLGQALRMASETPTSV